MCLPYKKVLHAGGKTFNYYIDNIANNDNIEVTLISKILPEEECYVSTVNPKIHLYLVETPKNKVKRIISYAKSINSKLNPCYRYGNILTKEIYDQIEDKLKILKSNGYEPDVIVLEWTSILLYIDVVKKYYPKSKYVASEHDVTFLGKEREYNFENNYIKRIIKKISYRTIKNNELESISKCNLVFTHNIKDKKLLIDNGINEGKVDTLVPFFEKFEKITHDFTNRNIVFYGAMNRPENYKSAIWFILNVMPKLNDLGIHLYIIGNKPPYELKKYENKNITVTGFVKDILPYFENSFCLVAPLLLGAGIKVKILEAFSAGIPVLTNEIGIEGIAAVDGRDYFLCNNPEEYVSKITLLLNNPKLAKQICLNELNVIDKYYDLEKSFVNYSSHLFE